MECNITGCREARRRQQEGEKTTGKTAVNVTSPSKYHPSDTTYTATHQPARPEYPSLSNRPEFEEFLSKSIIPPPPPPTSSRQALDAQKAAQSTSRDLQTAAADHCASPQRSPQKKVRFSANTHDTALSRQRSASGGLEKILAKKRLQSRLIKAAGRLRESRTFPTDDGPDVQSVMSRSGGPSMMDGQKADSLEDIYPSRGPPMEATQGVRTSVPPLSRRTTLGHFSGLENTDFCPPEIKCVSLKDFVGLEDSVTQGVASLEMSPAEDHTVAKAEGRVGRMYARIRSVDPGFHDAPNHSPKKLPTVSPMRTPPSVSPLKTIQEQSQSKEIKEDEIPNLQRVSLAAYSGLEQRADSECLSIKKVSLAQYSGLEAKDGLATKEKEKEQDSLISHFSASRKRSTLSKANSQGSEDLSWGSDDAVPTSSASYGSAGAIGSGLGNGFLTSATEGSERQPTPQDFTECMRELHTCVDRLNAAIRELPVQSPRRRSDDAALRQRATLRMALLNESQQVAAASKHLVRAATAQGAIPVSGGALLPHMAHSAVKSQGMTGAALALMRHGGCSLFQAQTLGAKVREVLVALIGIVQAVSFARGKALSDPDMKRLMRQSTTLAATLTQLIHCVREHYCSSTEQM